MPKSKHRRKPGGKAVKNPGKSGAINPPAIIDQEARTAAALASSDCFLRMILDNIDSRDGSSPSDTFGKRKMFDRFMQPIFLGEADYVDKITLDIKAAEEGLDLLVSEDMVEVHGDAITVHPRFTTENFRVACASRSASIVQSPIEIVRVYVSIMKQIPSF